MQSKAKGELQNLILADLEAEGNLAFLLIHSLVRQAAEKNLVGRVVRVDSHSDACGNAKLVAADTDRPAQSTVDAPGAGLRDDIRRLAHGQVSCQDNELVAAQASDRVMRPNRATEIFGDMSEKFVADVMAVRIVNQFEAIKIDHEERSASAVGGRLLDCSGELILKVTLIGKAREVIVEGIPLVRGDLLLEQNEQHSNSHEKLLQIPDFIRDGVVSQMVANPGVQKKDERPDHKTENDGDLAEAPAGQAQLEEHGGREINDKEDKISRAAKRVRRSKEPDWNPGTELHEEDPPTSSRIPGARDGECADDAEEESEGRDDMIGPWIVIAQTIKGEQCRGRNGVDRKIEQRRSAQKEVST